MDFNAFFADYESRKPKELQAYKEKWYQGDAPTYAETLGRIYSMKTWDDKSRVKANMALGQLRQMRSDPSSIYYDPYSTATNRAGQYLTNLGFNVDDLTDEWFANNQNYISSNLIYDGATNTPKAPGKKATFDQTAAYWLNQYQMSEGQTKKAEAEWKAAQEEARHWANDPDRNYSDDQVMDKVNENFSSKYPTLYKMMNSGNSPIELNRAVGYSQDALRASIWAARNNFTGSTEEAIAYSYLGRGKQWQEDPDISARLDPTNSSYAPYSFGSTNLDEAASRYNVYSFEPDWCSKHTDLLNGSEEDRKLYRQIYNAEQTTLAAEQALSALNKWVSTVDVSDPDEAISALDNILAGGKLWIDADGNVSTKKKRGYEEVDLGILNKMDISMGKGNNPPSGDLIALTRGVNYKYSDIVGQLEEKYAVRGNKKDSATTLQGLNPVYNATTGYVTDTESPVKTKAEEDWNREHPDVVYGTNNDKIAPKEKHIFELNAESQDRIAAKAIRTLHENLSSSERRLFTAFPGTNGSALVEAFVKAKEGILIDGPVDTKKLTNPEWIAQMASKQMEQAETDYLDTAFGSLQFRTEYELKKDDAEQTEAMIRQIKDEYGDAMLAVKPIPEVVTVEIDNTTGFTVNLRRDSDGRYRYHQSDNTAFDLSLPVQDFMNAKGIGEEELYKIINQKAREIDDYYTTVQDAKDRMFGTDNVQVLEDLDSGAKLEIPYAYDSESNQFVLSTSFNMDSDAVREYMEASGDTEESILADIKDYINGLNEQLNIPDEKTINALQARLDDDNTYLQNHQADYDAAVEAERNANNRRVRTAGITLRNAGQEFVIDPADSTALLEYVASWTGMKVPEDGYDSLIEDLQNEYALDYTETDGKEISAHIVELNRNASLLRKVVDQYDNLPEYYKKTMTEFADYYESRARLYEDYLITKDADYDKLVEEGMRLSTASLRDKWGWGQMTEAEQDIYYAMFAKYGEDKAHQFYEDIEGSLLVRAKTNIAENAKEFAEAGLHGRIFNELVSVGSSVLEVPLNAAYLAGSVFNGEGNKWLRLMSYAGKQAHGAVMNEVHRLYKGTPVDTLASAMYEIINNRGRSRAVGRVFNGIIPDIEKYESLNDIVHSTPIAIIAFGDGYEDAMDRDLSPAQAWILGAVNFVSESVTEGIKFGHYKETFDPDFSLKSYMEFFGERIAENEWLSEIIGEDLNNILERSFDKWVAGDKSEHEERIQMYIDSGLVKTRKEAEAMVAADYLSEDIHTAIISGISSFTDVGSLVLGKTFDTFRYVKEYVKTNLNSDTAVKFSDIRNSDIQRRKAFQEYRKVVERYQQKMQDRAQDQEGKQEAAENQTEVVANPAIVSEETQNSQQTEYDVDSIILENSFGSDQQTVTANIAAILRVNGDNTNRATAAAMAFASLNGDLSIGELQNLLDGGRESGTNINTLKLGIQYAMLADGECRRVMQSDEYQQADKAEKAKMLSMAVQADATNTAVQDAVGASVHEARVTQEEQRVLSEEGVTDKAEAAMKRYQEAVRKTYYAKTNLENQQGVEAAAGEAVAEAGETVANNPSDENIKQLDRAWQDQKSAAAVTQEWVQSVENAEQAERTAEQEANDANEEALAKVRQEAEARVADMEKRENAEAEQRAEAERIAQEQEAKRQAEEDERTGKAQEDADMAKINAQIEKMNLRGEQAEQLRQKLTQFYQDMKTGNVDTSGLLTDAESAMVIGDMSRKLGVQIEVDKEGDPNALPEGKDGKYSNGKITLSHRLTVGQAMLQVAMHEITHSLEKTKSYAKYKDTVFDILFSSPEQREKAIQDKMNLYQQNGVKDFTREDAEHEIVADFAMNDKTFANRNTINRMLDEGLGGKIRNALHNINQYLKNAKLEGDERVNAENLRKAERLYIKAINERRDINTHPSSEQFSVNQFAAAAGLFYNEVNITDDKGNVIAAPGLYTADPSNPDNNAVKIDKVTPEMMENTPVGQLTNAALALGTMDHETVGKIHKMFADLMTMCTNLQDTNLVWEIAGSTLYSEFSAIKSNSDKQYSTTVDFGTICTKTQAVINQLSRDMLRLGRGLTSQEILDVYNDVYNADLKVPCPVCYVFSRWLGVPSLLENIRQYQNRFLGEEGSEVSLEETQRRVDEFIAKAHNEDYNIDEKFIEAQAKARQAALDKIDRIKNGKNGIAQTEAKIAKYRDQLAVKPNGNTVRYLASAEKKLATLQENLAQAQTDYENSDIAAYAKVINKKKADLEKSIKDKLIRIEGDDKGKRGINDDIRDAIKEGKPTDKLEAKRTAVYGEIDELNKKLREVDAYNWVTQALCRLDENGRFVVDDAFKRTKNEILLDLNRTGEFAKDIKNWTYRSTRGAGMGKAILPYSGATIGDSVLGTGARVMANPFESGDAQGAFNALKSAIIKGKRQNLIGGQRFQSTSDFRPEWGLDYIMTFIEQQAIGSNGQLYTKVKEFAPMAASSGIDTNCSIMPYANGWHDPSDGEIEAMSETERRSRVVTFKDEDGNERTVILDFSDVTGMEYDAARDLSKSFDSVQMIMVGINDIHIRACLAGEEIDFVIPWHASGNTKSQLQSMMQTVKETLTNSSDYTKVQSDQIADKKALETAHGKQERDEALTAYEKELIHKEQMRDARQRLLTGATLTATDMERIKESQFLTSLYERFEGKTLDGKELPHDSAYWIEFPEELNIPSERVKMTSSQAEQIFPYEYWDTTLTKDQADENGWRFVQYCQELGLVPRFSGGNQKDETTGETSRFGNFSGAVYDENGNIIGYERDRMAKGYWKTLIDRKMYDNNGNYRSQQHIDASKIQTGSLVQGDEGRIHVDSNIPDSISGANYRGEEAEAKYRQADQALKDRLTEKAKLKGKEGEQARIDLERINAWETAHAEDREQYRVTPEINPYDDLTSGEMMQILSDAGIDYADAVARGDMEAAQEDVDFYAEQAFADSKVRDLDGNLLKVYHGTNADFNEFRRDMIGSTGRFEGSGFNFTPYEGRASSYGKNVLAGYLDIKNPLSSEEKTISIAKLAQIIREADPTGDNIISDYARETRDYGKASFVQREAMTAARSVWESSENDVDIYSFISAADSDAEGLIKAFESLGYDGLIHYNDDGTIKTAVAFSSKQFKKADPVTYDDNGNVIPLDQRFSDSSDIRYKVSDNNAEMTSAEMLQLFRDAGVVTQEQVDAYRQKTSRPLEGKSRKWSQTEGPAQRQFGGENGMLQESDEIAQQAIDYVQAHNAYFPDTNEDQIVRAINWIRKNGSERGEDGSLTQKTDGYYESVKKVTSKTFDYRSADGQARMIATMAMAVAKNDVAAQVELADAFNRQGTDLGRALQSRKLFRLMTPEGRIASLQKMMQNTADELGAKGINADLKFSDWIYRAAAAAVEESDFFKVQQAAAAELASQIPANWRDKFRSWRMLSMLGNPRTHIRNVIGNAFFVPVVSMKNKLGAIMELGVEQGQRTKTLAPILSSEIREFARQDAKTMKDTLTGEAKFNETTMVQREQKAFNGLLQALIDFNGNALEAEDWYFLKGHYRRALGGWMQANGYTAEQLRTDPALLEQGRAYAVQEAQKATYRDFNRLAATLNKVSRDGGIAGFLTDAVLPFKKTPANILRRGVEYSPVGIMKSLTADLYHLKQYKDYQNGKLSVMPEKAITPTQFIDDFCSGLAGTAVMAVGFLLGRAGIVSCGLGDDDDEFEKAKGNQKYALKFNIGGQDFTFTMDWAAPMSMPFFVGAAVQEQYEKDGEYDVEALLNAFGNITEPVFNLSMLDGVNSLLKITQSNGQDSNTTLTQIGGKIMSNYATSYVPSLLGAIARTIDDKQRKAYVESGKGTGLMGTFRYAREQTENKIPGLSQTNIPMRDIWGNENTSSLAERILENFILPGYVNEYKEDPIIDEMARLWEATGDKALVPDADPDKTVTYNKQKHVLTAEQWDQYKENRNKTAHEMLTRLIESEDYQNATDAAQAQMIKNIWSYADKVGKQAVFPDYEVEEKGDPVAKATLEGKVATYKTDMMTSLESGDYDGYDTMVEALHELGVEDSEIKTKIGNTYRDQYKEAYRKGDEAKMAEIEDILDNTGFDFDIDKWEEQVDEKYGL